MEDHLDLLKYFIKKMSLVNFFLLYFGRSFDFCEDFIILGKLHSKIKIN